MAGLNDALWIVGSYIVAFALFYALLNFLTKGFLYQYLKVKMSRGKLVLVKCHGITDSYYKASFIDNKKNLIVKDRMAKIHTFSDLDMNYVKRELGVNLIEVDLVKGLLIKKDFSSAKGYDITMTDDLINRALMLPKLAGDDAWEKAQKIILIMILLGVGVLIYLYFMDPAGASAAGQTATTVNI